MPSGQSIDTSEADRKESGASEEFFYANNEPKSALGMRMCQGVFCRYEQKDRKGGHILDKISDLSKN